MNCVAPWVYFAHLAADAQSQILADLTDLEAAILGSDAGFMSRPDQAAPDTDWSVLGCIAGRGWGKSFFLAHLVNAGVKNGSFTNIGLIAQDDDKTVLNQVRPLIDYSPPWFRPQMVNGLLVWPNGVTATLHTPESPAKIRGANHDLTWCSEIVGWPRAKAEDAWENVSTATRVGASRIVYDTTSKGRNALITRLVAMNERDPKAYPIVRGTMFDNTTLSKAYIQRTAAQYSGRRYEEEVNGATFSETDGASFTQHDIDRARVEETPKLVQILVGSDPAITDHAGSDETGLIVAALDARGEIYVLRDLTGKHNPEEHGALLYAEYLRGASGVVLERNAGGNYITFAVRATFNLHDIKVVVVAKDRVMPPFTRGTFYVREVHARGAKNSAERAGGPSTLYAQSKVHHVGYLEDLESELCTFETGSSESPNRYDAAMHVISELSGITSERPTPQARSARAAGDSKASAELRDRLRRIGSGRSVT